MLSSRRIAFAAAAVLIGLSSCGDSSPRTIVSQAPAVIHFGAGSSGGSNAAPTADRMMMAWQDITYVFDGALPDLGSTGAAWTLPAGGSPDVAQVKRIAELLGVAGDVVALPADQGGGWMVGAADYSTATLTVGADGMLSWWFNPSPASVGGWACAEPGSAGEAVPPSDAGAGTDAAPTLPEVAPPDTTCVAPPPPANVPDKDAALAKAKQLFVDMGYDTAAYEFEAYADE